MNLKDLRICKEDIKPSRYQVTKLGLRAVQNEHTATNSDDACQQKGNSAARPYSLNLQVDPLLRLSPLTTTFEITPSVLSRKCPTCHSRVAVSTSSKFQNVCSITKHPSLSTLPMPAVKNSERERHVSRRKKWLPVKGGRGE